MVSRDTAVHATVVTLAFAGLAVVAGYVSDPELLALAGFLLFNGTVLAGSHLYLAARGEDGLVPVSARWRFVGVVAAVLALGAVSIVTDPVSLGPVTSDAVLAGLGAVVAVAYLVAEARSGYRESTGDADA